MAIINGFSISQGDQVLIGSKCARSHSYTEVEGEVCTYNRRAATHNRHVVYSKLSGQWFIEEEDIRPVALYTNAEAIKLLKGRG